MISQLYNIFRSVLYCLKDDLHNRALVEENGPQYADTHVYGTGSIFVYVCMRIVYYLLG